jgi:glyoxylate/hydroxypyruvate reductase A
MATRRFPGWLGVSRHSSDQRAWIANVVFLDRIGRPTDQPEARFITAKIDSNHFFVRPTSQFCLLPLTRETEGIFQARTFALMPRGSMLVNVGPGKHVEADLIEALDSGQLAYAALGALWPEPLPAAGALWLHPKVTIMSHVAQGPTAAQLVTEIAANIRNAQAGGALLQEIDKTKGY